MKISDIPKVAFSDKPVKVPTKVVVVPDWEAFHGLILKQGFAVIECDEQDLRTTSAGGHEAPLVKAFNSWCRFHLKQHAKTKRITANRWFICL